LNVDPTDAAPLQVPLADEPDDIAMRDKARLMYPLIRGQQFPAAAPIADEEFAMDQLVPGYLIELEESV
jgi:hypothetical protein